MLRHLKPAYPEGITTNRLTNSVCAALAISQSNRWWVMLSILFPQITSALDLLCTPSIPATRQLHLRARMASNHLCHRLAWIPTQVYVIPIEIQLLLVLPFLLSLRCSGM